MENENKIPFVIVLGANGSGKGSSGKEAALELELTPLVTSQIIRDYGVVNSDFWEVAQECMAKRKLIPSGLLKEAMAWKLQLFFPDQGLLFDGIPRSYQQGVDLLGILREFDNPFMDLRVIALECRLSTAIQNCTKRYKKDCEVGRGRDEDSSIANIADRYLLHQQEIEPILQLFTTEGIPVKRIPIDDDMPDGFCHSVGTIASRIIGVVRGWDSMSVDIHASILDAQARRTLTAV